MNQLIKVETKTIGDEEVNAVDARELHNFLNIKEHFNEWIKRYLTEYEFVNNSDFCRSTCVAENGRKMETFFLSLDMAKELSMLSKTVKGKEARKYFIQCEKMLREQDTVKSIDLPEIANHLESSIKIAGLLGLDKNQSIHSANTMVRRISGFDCMREFGVTAIEYKPNIQYHTPSILGDMAGISAAKMNRILEEKGLQYETRDHKNRLVWTVTEKGKEFSRLFDTKKLKSDGTPIMQTKWADTVLSI